VGTLLNWALVLVIVLVALSLVHGPGDVARGAHQSSGPPGNDHRRAPPAAPGAGWADLRAVKDLARQERIVANVVKEWVAGQ
jgi:hypothetical protein